MIELDGLLFLGIEKLREDNPSEHQAGHQSEYEKQGNGTTGTLIGFGLLRGGVFFTPSLAAGRLGTFCPVFHSSISILSTMQRFLFVHF